MGQTNNKAAEKAAKAASAKDEHDALKRRSDELHAERDEAVKSPPEEAAFQSPVGAVIASAVPLADGVYYRVDRVDEIEAMLTEVIIKDNFVVAHCQWRDVSRIMLGKLIHKIGAGYHEKEKKGGG